MKKKLTKALALVLLLCMLLPQTALAYTTYYVEVTISDEGVGIAQAEIPHIFDRFHHTRDASRDSTGLGLTITREIALRHGIAIDVRSREGEGTTFSFTFPEQNA